MALKGRHYWFSERIAQTFGPAVNDSDAQAFVRAQLPRFNALLEAGGPPALFVFRQARHEGGAGAVGEKDAEPRLFLADSHDEKIRSLCCYFVRADVGKSAADQEIMYGELQPSLLQTLATQISHLYGPIFAGLASWGKAQPEQCESFQREATKFSADLTEAHKHLVGGVDLKKPSEGSMATILASAAKAAAAAAAEAAAADGTGATPKHGGAGAHMSAAHRAEMEAEAAEAARALQEAVTECSALLLEWCDDIDECVREENEFTLCEVTRQHLLQELDFWRRRMQRLISITEQLKMPACKAVLGALSSAVKRSLGSANRPASAGLAGALVEEGGPEETTPRDDGGLSELLRRWQATDAKLTDAANEAKDNVKYLFTLERFLEPLYKGTPAQVTELCPALLNSIKMIHTIARYYPTPQRMTGLFAKITNTLISNCKRCLLGGADETVMNSATVLWGRDPAGLVADLKSAIALNTAYQEQYHVTKAKLAAMNASGNGSTRQFEGFVAEAEVFAKFDLFAVRAAKLIDLFSTIHQFRTLAENKIEGMEYVAKEFDTMFADFQRKRHDLLAFSNNQFDRDFVAFNRQISKLEALLQRFIDSSFAQCSDSIEHSLELLSKFEKIIERDSLKADLEAKLLQIFGSYHEELQGVRTLYDEQKQAPPIPRNMPPVAGNIAWSRLLLKRIEEPMKRFETNHKLLATPNANTVVRLYNKVARMLVAFEYLWFQAWVQSVEQATAGLLATLIVRAEDGTMHVNFDPSILQLVHEAKSLSRMGIDIPAGAMALLNQESKFKRYFNELQWMLMQCDQVHNVVTPVTNRVLAPLLKDLDLTLAPGLTSLQWNSMNIETYIQSVESTALRLGELVNQMKDVSENRVENVMKRISKEMMVNLRADHSFTLLDYVAQQQLFVAQASRSLQARNVEVEAAVADIGAMIRAYEIDEKAGEVDEKALKALKVHYNKMMYTALLHAAKKSLNALKKRVGSHSTPKGGGLHGMLGMMSQVAVSEVPFFEVDVTIKGHGSDRTVSLNPALEDIQSSISEAAKSVLGCMRELWDWGQDGYNPTVMMAAAAEGAPAAAGAGAGGKGRRSSSVPDPAQVRRASLKMLQREGKTFFDRVTQDIEIVRVCLLLTGSVHGTKHHVQEYMKSFETYSWLWETSAEGEYEKFVETKPEIQEFEHKLQWFQQVADEIEHRPAMHSVGCLSLSTKGVKMQLAEMLSEWKIVFADNLRAEARRQMESIFDYIRQTETKLKRDVNDLDSLQAVMNVLKIVRDKEADIELDISPILAMYKMLEFHLPHGKISQEERDEAQVMRSHWRKLVTQCEAITYELSLRQYDFKRTLLSDIRDFKADMEHFRSDYNDNGPMVQGIKPMDAVERLARYKEEFSHRERKYALLNNGEHLFKLQITEYPDMHLLQKELDLQTKLFDLYVDVIHTMEEWQSIGWDKVQENIEEMTSTVDGFGLRCKRMPARLRTWDAYIELKKTIEDFQNVLPLLQELSKPSIMGRHWKEVMEITKSDFDPEDPEFSLKTLLDAKIIDFAEEIEEVTEGADKQLKIEQQLKEVREKWEVQEFNFQEWQDRKVATLKQTTPIVEDLEDAEMVLQTLLTMRHVTPFREEASSQLQSLSDTSETLERWIKVQMLWCSLESVFTGGDIAKQMPLEAKKFQGIDKNWLKIMGKAEDTKNVVECCSNEVLATTLPAMYADLEKCQKSLEGYLEQKRNCFPRFYFVSNPGLLLILSQGSDPLSMNQYYEKVFDSISCVIHNPTDKTQILQIVAPNEAEIVPFSTIVRAVGNIEGWLAELLKQMQVSMKDICRNAAADVLALEDPKAALRGFVDSYIAQCALLGIQLMWTADQQQALEGCRTKKTVMKECSTKELGVLSEISSWCLQDLGRKENRTKIETLVTIHVHQRDVTQDVFKLYKDKNISDANDFEWLKQARFYWKGEQGDECDEEGACVISVCDVDFNYQYEYLGCKERLVVTPLTDRCYITLSQALGMYFGGAPAGPAGTGKTETVKDLGRALGMWVVVTNCTDQMKYTDCAKIFKGLCQGGLWGCFDEFNRIVLPVLSVVAQQVLAIQNAKKSGATFFQFPGEPQDIIILPVCGFFITMNPGYAGRQELPENLKALFRGVTMMVPNFEIIMKVKLCSVGFSEFNMLGKKFFVLYNTCKEQLSNQKHYDWGLRNILSVLRTGGATKRANLDKAESTLMYQTLRDMNLSKLVAQDVPLFLSLLSDLFPTTAFPAKGDYPEVQEALSKAVTDTGLINHAGWLNKVIQLYETHLVRHGIMLVGPTGGGKSRIFDMLQAACTVALKTTYKMSKLNPKGIRAPEMYGEVDPASGEWTTGVFAAMWQKYNNRANKFNTWIVADGPVDAIWIEDLNTVLDDNKILTLANGDRIPMTANVKLMFEVETLVNASPATVSRAGIVYVSDTDLDWAPVLEAWLLTRPAAHVEVLRPLCARYMGSNSPIDPGHLIDFLNRKTHQVMSVSRVGQIARLTNLLTGLIDGAGAANLSSDPEELALQLEKLLIYSLTWSMGGLLEPDDRVLFDATLREFAEEGGTGASMPECAEGETLYEYFVNPETMEWELWRPPLWKYPKGSTLDYSNLLVPTMDSTRSLFLVKTIHKQRLPVLMVGGSGTAKTSTAQMFFHTLSPDEMLIKTISFSSATTPFMFQSTVEAELDKRGGKNFGPPNSKRMTVFLDDVSMPLVNDWGDQPTLECVRLIVEQGYFCFLDKDKRGEKKVCEDLQYLGGMGHPGGGRNDIPNRLKRHFFIFNLVLPSLTSINDIYGQMLEGRFPAKEFNAATMSVVTMLTKATIDLWGTVKAKMLPTPAKFHYVFNMRDLSRVFQGVLLTPKETILTGGGIMATDGVNSKQPPDSEQPVAVKNRRIDKMKPEVVLLGLWKHECERVFCDKLTCHEDKDKFHTYMDKALVGHYSEELNAAVGAGPIMVSFLRNDIEDEEGVFLEEAPKVYESGGTLTQVRERVNEFMNVHDFDYPQKKLGLVLFDDALAHLLRISRLIETPRGSGLLVGVGGSGKQSLTRLASYIAKAMCFQITLTKQYNIASLMEDLRTMYKNAGAARKPTVFLFTESEIKNEGFLEVINSVLMTGEVANLFAKDEMMAMTADLHNAFLKERPGLEETPVNLKQFFTDSVRDNLHMMLCMSPLNPKFPERARQFPGLISAPTIDWFLPWPAEALVAVSYGLIGNYQIECTAKVKTSVMDHMGNVHSMANEVCLEYDEKMQRKVYQTPKSYLSFLNSYKIMYSEKLGEIQIKEGRVRLGLEKLIQGASDVEDMKVVLAKEQIKLEKATADTNKMLTSLEASSSEAKTEGEAVAVIAAGCEADAERIGGEKTACMADLAKAQPLVDQAVTAIDSIKPAHIGEIKKNNKPTDIIKLVFDGVLLLFQNPMAPCAEATLFVAKQDLNFIEPSFTPHAQTMLASATFLGDLQEFGRTGKDIISPETIELLLPYIEIETFTPAVAKSASSAAEGLCTFVIAMKSYHEASKIVKPKLEALAIAEGQLEAAMTALAAAQEKLKGCNERLAELQNVFDAQMSEKKRIEDGALKLQRQSSQASQLIEGLAGERARWTDDAENFHITKERLVGDCAIACAFISYCGAFNQAFRGFLQSEKFARDCRERNVPCTKDLDLITFCADIGTIGDWNMEGLPTDPLSIQNGILVTRSSRFPLLIDPQGQALNWIRCREEQRLPHFGVTTLVHPKLKDQLEFAMAEGKALLIINVEEDIDPMFDPVLEKQLIKKGKKYTVNVSDKSMDYDMKFSMYFVTRLPNPHYSPELQAKTTLVDFTVTQKGLEEQLLGRVIGKEQKALEEQLKAVLEDVNANTKSLLALDASLLERLSSNTGNLLEDEELIGVLAETKAAAADVKEKLQAADETKRNINEKREQFRPVATRGSVLYFAIVECSKVNVMYQTSLAQFIVKFNESMDKAEKAALASKRVENIIKTMTYLTYRYINRGLYESDKLLFVLLMTLKVILTAGRLTGSDVTLLLRGGAALDIKSARKKQFNWMTDEAWLNVVQLTQQNKFFGNMINEMSGNETMWRRWYEDNEPEEMPVPDYDSHLAERAADNGPFLKLLMVRSLRVDRCVLACMEFIRNTTEMGQQYIDPATDTIENIYDDSESEVPVIFLLSTGADPTETIEQLARKRKLPSPAVVSLGEGQEPVAIKAINAAAVAGTWVLLQNCELGLPLMEIMEDLLQKLHKDEGFRLFISALPNKDFPLGLLQMSTKVTNEPPAGLRAGLMRSYTISVDQDRLERVETVQWRQLLFALCFVHSVVYERRKFGPLGWCVPYEFNTGDLSACIQFLEKHLYNGPISWPTLQYMVAEAQYGGKITDNTDRRMFGLYAARWLDKNSCQPDFVFNPTSPIRPIPNNCVYSVPVSDKIDDFRKYCASLPETDSPEITGLHPNADLTFRVKQANFLLAQMGMTQPKGGGAGAGGLSRADVVSAKAAEFLERLPPDFEEGEYKSRIQKLGGLTIPLNIFLFQEIQRLQNVLAKVRFMLTQLRLAIQGEVVMTDDLQATLDAIFDATVPRMWVFTISGDEFSWILPTLGLWFSSLLQRDHQNRTWMNEGRPNSFWLTGFFNPQGLLTAMKQEVTRRHKKENWALDDVVYQCEVKEFLTENAVKVPPDEGIYLHGLYLDGCAWSKPENQLVESEPKKLFTLLPVIHVTGNIKGDAAKVRRQMFGATGPYECPVYKYPTRTDRFYVFSVTLQCNEVKNPAHWGLRGTALLCNTD